MMSLNNINCQISAKFVNVSHRNDIVFAITSDIYDVVCMSTAIQPRMENRKSDHFKSLERLTYINFVFTSN